MKIMKDNLTINIVTISPGETFEHNGVFYIKTDHMGASDMYGAVNLASGKLTYFDETNKIHRVNLEVVIK